MKTLTLIPTLFLIGILACPVISYSAEKGLVAYWAFEDEKGGTASDASGNGHDGELLGDPQWTDGYFGGGLEFDQAGDEVSIPFHKDLNAETFTRALFDGERDGLLLGVGVGFAGVISSTVEYYGYTDPDVRSGWIASGKIGYGLSDQLALFLSSPVRDFSPHFGFMYFTERGVYLQGLVGFLTYENAHFASSDEYEDYQDYHFYDREERHLLISGGVGYELRDQISLEFMLGYTRFSDIESRRGEGLEVIQEKVTTHIMMIAVTFNVHFY